MHCSLALLYGEPAEVAFMNRYAHLVSQPFVSFSASHGARLPDTFKSQLASLPGITGWLVCQSPKWDRSERMKSDVCSAAFAKIYIRPVTVVAAIDFPMSADPH